MPASRSNNSLYEETAARAFQGLEPGRRGSRDFAPAEVSDGEGSTRWLHRWASAAQTISWI